MSQLATLLTTIFLFVCSTCAYAETTIALTTTVSAHATAEEKTLMQGLLPLLEVAVGEKEGLQVVEREAVATMVAELVRSLGASETVPLQIGKLPVTHELFPRTQRGRKLARLVKNREEVKALVHKNLSVPISNP